jgi:hypothetical protein
MKLKDIKEMNFEPVPAGAWYQLQIVSMEDGTTKEKGTPKSDLELVIVDGEHVGHKIFHTLWRTEKSIGFLKPFLIAAGFSEEDDIEVHNGEITLYEAQLKGKQLMGYVTGYRTWTTEGGDERKAEVLGQFKKPEAVVEYADIEIPF